MDGVFKEQVVYVVFYVFFVLDSERNPGTEQTAWTNYIVLHGAGLDKPQNKRSNAQSTEEMGSSWGLLAGHTTAGWSERERQLESARYRSERMKLVNSTPQD